MNLAQIFYANPSTALLLFLVLAIAIFGGNKFGKPMPVVALALLVVFYFVAKRVLSTEATINFLPEIIQVLKTTLPFIICFFIGKLIVSTFGRAAYDISIKSGSSERQARKDDKK